jgi:hypothetical protein
MGLGKDDLSEANTGSQARRASDVINSWCRFSKGTITKAIATS